MAIFDTFHTISRVSCRRWACPDCGPRKAAVLRARLQLTQPQRFLTLTLRPDPSKTPLETLTFLRECWPKLRKRLARYHQTTTIEYVLIIEWTHKDTPHAHILTNMPYTPQAWISQAWRDITGSYIVDIRSVEHNQRAAKYLTDYLNKQQWMPPKKRKWTASRHFLPQLPPFERQEDDVLPEWHYSTRSPERLLNTYEREGYQLIELTPDTVIALKPPQLQTTSPPPNLLAPSRTTQANPP